MKVVQVAGCKLQVSGSSLIVLRASFFVFPKTHIQRLFFVVFAFFVVHFQNPV